jgi:accessory gene regulator protein AgrB
MRKKEKRKRATMMMVMMMVMMMAHRISSVWMWVGGLNQSIVSFH